MKSPADIVAIFERRSESYRRATADVASYGLAYREAPSYTPAKDAYHRAVRLQAEARLRMEVQANSISYAINGEVAAHLLDVARRNADLAGQIAVAEAQARRPRLGVA